MLDGSSTGELNTLAITAQGEHFVSGGQDKIVKVWSYDEGISYFQGIGHSGAIQKIAIAPNGKFIVTVGSEGAIFMWHTPESVQNAQGTTQH
jgi:WD40 repeat protein